MLEERREWILEVRKQTGAFPVELEAFYTRFEVPDKVSVGVHVMRLMDSNRSRKRLLLKERRMRKRLLLKRR